MTGPCLAVLLYLLCHACGELLEEDRLSHYYERNYQWPPLPSEFQPSTAGWHALQQRRLTQVARNQQHLNAKYNGYMSVIHSALIAPNFTEFGWALTRGPPDLVDALWDRLQHGLASPDTPLEEYDRSSVQDEYPLERPLMIPNEDLNRRVLRELRPIHEAWSGVHLVGNNAYGLRVYRNQSNLQMHIDESSTHIISSILHIGHDPDGEPWPLVIEDLTGNTQEVFLETGDMILYESSKCFHGRPKRYNGKWYSSIFTHYYPTDWDPETVNLETHYRIPPDWDKVPTDSDEHFEQIVVSETSFKEPECQHEWCGLKKTTKWSRPDGLDYGKILSSDGVVKSLVLEEREDEDMEGYTVEEEYLEDETEIEEDIEDEIFEDEDTEYESLEDEIIENGDEF